MSSILFLQSRFLVLSRIRLRLRSSLSRPRSVSSYRDFFFMCGRAVSIHLSLLFSHRAFPVAVWLFVSRVLCQHAISRRSSKHVCTHWPAPHTSTSAQQMMSLDFAALSHVVVDKITHPTNYALTSRSDEGSRKRTGLRTGRVSGTASTKVVS